MLHRRSIYAARGRLVSLIHAVSLWLSHPGSHITPVEDSFCPRVAPAQCPRSQRDASICTPQQAVLIAGSSIGYVLPKTTL
ncbi:hypothetical protein GY45DRAFT_1329057 [Cubamyces sp. BRFM 1775]|nr:hypothetical protein GY45DRAFT_1329057 [Cubamyces sp. BRFM 1775]